MTKQVQGLPLLAESLQRRKIQITTQKRKMTKALILKVASQIEGSIKSKKAVTEMSKAVKKMMNTSNQKGTRWD